MSQPAQRPARYDDLFDLPDNVVGEIIAGELIVSRRPAPRHAVATSALGGSLTPPFQFGDGGPGGWWILDEPELHLGEDVLVPDLAGWRRERLPAIPETPHFSIAPDWVCEVLSPSTARQDRVLKQPLYARHGVAHLWLVDANNRTLEVLENEGGKWVVAGAFAGDQSVRAEPFSAVALRLGLLWGT